MEKMPNLNDVFLSIMASLIGFGLVLGIAQAAFDFGGGRSLLLSSPVFAQTLGSTPNRVVGVASCLSGQVFVPDGPGEDIGICQCPVNYQFQYPNNIGSDRGGCILANPALDMVATSTCPDGYEKKPDLWTDNIKKACTLAAQKLKLLDAQCMVDAVEKRDNAILTGMDSSYSTQRNLIVVRGRDLKNAWMISDRQERRAEIARIWNKYRADIKYMQRRSNIMKTNVWKQFMVDRKACGTYATADDYAGVGVDNSLQLFIPTL